MKSFPPPQLNLSAIVNLEYPLPHPKWVYTNFLQVFSQNTVLTYSHVK